MKRLGLFLLVLVAALAGARHSLAGERVNETRDASPDGFVRITVARGNLVVKGWDQNRIQVEGELDDEAEAFIFDVSRGDAVIEVKLPRNLSRWSPFGASDLTIRLPKGSNVDVSGVSTDVEVTDIEGGLELSGVSGDLGVRHIADRLDVTTVSGDVDVVDASERIAVKTVSGDVDISGSSGDFRLHSVSGDVLGRELDGAFDLESVSGSIEILKSAFDGLRGHTVSGDIDVTAEMARAGTVELDSVSGSIELRFIGDVDARFDLETGSGSIRNHLSDDKPKSSTYVRDETLRFVLGEGQGQVIVRTRSGDIVVSVD